MSHINKKELQTGFIVLEYFVPCLRDIHVQLSVDNSAAVSYLNHAGRTRSQALSDLAITIWEWCLQRKLYLSAIHIPDIVNKTPDGISRQKLERTEWILDSNVFHQIAGVYQQRQVDLFASHQNHQLPNYFSWIQDPQAVRTYPFSISWKFKLCYLFPPFPLIQKCIQKIKQDQTDALLITPVSKSRPLYNILLEMLIDRPALLPLHTKLLHLPMFPSQVHPLMKKKIDLAVWPVLRNPLKSEEFLKGCPKYCFPHGDAVQRSITTSQHGNNLIAGVLKNQKIPISCPVNIVSEFLTDLFDKGLQYRTINTYHSAISMTHLPVDGSLIDSHPLVSRFVKGVFQSGPPFPRYLAT